MLKKRASGETPVKNLAIRKQSLESGDQLSPAAIEESLALPSIGTINEHDLLSVVLLTNRAPLVLAFAVTLLNHTMPNQPLSSRLSLAQAVVSANAKSKAVSLGIEKGPGAEGEGWGQGQPTVRVMGREIRVMKRWGYDWKETSTMGSFTHEKTQVMDSQATMKQDDNQDDEPALWGLDLEALRKSNGPLASGTQSARGAGLPIYSAQAARAYLLKAFASPPEPNTTASSKKKKTAAALQAEKDQNLAHLLQALEMLYDSWAHVLSHDELDRRAWAWYVAVRPEVQSGVAGWGGKGEVKLWQILEMRRKGIQTQEAATQNPGMPESTSVSEKPEPTQDSEMPDPTQDEGFSMSSLPPSTVDTVLLSGRPG